jgi:hypothetical protein
MNEKKALFCVAGIFSVSHLLAIEIIEWSSLVYDVARKDSRRSTEK